MYAWALGFVIQTWCISEDKIMFFILWQKSSLTAFKEIFPKYRVFAYTDIQNGYFHILPCVDKWD